MKMKFTLCCLVALLPLTGLAQQTQFNIVDLGAKGDGKSDNTTVIQKTIDKAAETKSATVLIPAGRFMTGPIKLRSGVNLHLQENAVLLASPKRLDYGGTGNAVPLITADNQQNISITGKGTIDGNGKKLLADLFKLLKKGVIQDNAWQKYNPWHQKQPEERNRPRLVLLTNCSNIVVKNVKFIDGTDWIQDFKFCENIVVDSISVISNLYWNNDGIDIVDCRNVKVTNSFFDCDDDAICLKSESRKFYCDGVYVANCKVRSSASAIKLGTASAGGFKNITIKDIEVYDTFRSAIAIEAVDGGFIDNINVENINATNTGNAIFIRLGHRNKDTVNSRVSNIRIANVSVSVPGGKPDKGYPMEGPIVREPHHLLPCVIAGLPGFPVKNVVLENIKVTYGGRYNNGLATISADSIHLVPERPSDYPEFSMFGDLPAWGLYVRHVEGLSLKNVSMSPQRDDKRAALVFHDVDGLNIEGLNLPTAANKPVIIAKEVKGLSAAAQKLIADNDKAVILNK